VKLELNCDLGEGEPVVRTRALMRWINLANVACGGHAGSVKTMQGCVRLAQQFGVRLGAHPGPWNRGDFGRGAVQLSPGELELLLVQQVGALEQIARAEGARLHHIKLHGALYHASEAVEDLGRCYVEAVARWWPGVKILALAGGSVARLGRKRSVAVWEEAFADRAYRDDGSLVPRGERGALAASIGEVLDRVESMLDRNEVTTISGRRFPLTPKTVCLHSDTPHALGWARAVSRRLNARP
jgi:UPF0271 protein